jgi:hypothetical protein
MPESKNFGVISGSLGEKSAPLRRKVDELIREIRASEVGPRLSAQFLGKHPVVVWLPHTRDPNYRAHLADQCLRLAELTADEESMASAFEQEAAQTPGWR